ncbi:hypothetical protein H8959_004693 [Pygathrix nigripes]
MWTKAWSLQPGAVDEQPVYWKVEFHTSQGRVPHLSGWGQSRTELCMSDKLWEQIVQSTCHTITPDVRALAEDTGWRQLFFTSKLQLQRQLRKRKQKYGNLREKQP